MSRRVTPAYEIEQIVKEVRRAQNRGEGFPSVTLRLATPLSGLQALRPRIERCLTENPKNDAERSGLEALTEALANPGGFPSVISVTITFSTSLPELQAIRARIDRCLREKPESDAEHHAMKALAVALANPL